MIITILLAVAGALLYRLRGGWFHDLTGIKSTQLMRAMWAIPTALCIYAFSGGPWWLIPALIVSVFASLALIGHGAHMVFDTKVWMATSKNKTELLTFWLPWAFGTPAPTWPDDKSATFNLVGMSTIGVVRNTLAIAPLFFVPAAVLPSIFYAATGAMHGPLYWAGWRLKGNSATGELLVGFWSWGLIAALYQL